MSLFGFKNSLSSQGEGITRVKRKANSYPSFSKREKHDTSKRTPLTLPQLTIDEYAAPENTDWSKWFSATSTKNYIMRDPLLDWLQYNRNSNIVKLLRDDNVPVGCIEELEYTNSADNSNTNNNNSNNDNVNNNSIQKQHPSIPDDFTQFIMKRGMEFEKEVIKLLKRVVKSGNIIDIGGLNDPRSQYAVKKTIDAMNLGIPIIYNGVLHNIENNTYGVPDIIIRSDWIDKIFCDDDNSGYIKNNEKYESALRLRNKHNKIPTYHYRIIDIKFTTLRLRSDGIHILNCGLFPAYKSQLLIYNNALARIQGYNPKCAYLLGRRYRYTSRRRKYIGDAYFNRLGVIDYITTDSLYNEKTTQALQWLSEVRSELSTGYNILTTPLTREELYPNMCNTYDYPFTHIKKRIANHIKELTLLWSIGTKNREIAHTQGIYSWDSVRCNSTTLGIKRYTHRSKVVNKILEVNVRNKSLVLPRVINNVDIRNVMNEIPIKFYVDFETINDIFDNVDFTGEMIFMIGIGYCDPENGKWIYKNFTVDSLNNRCEKIVCYKFVNYIHNIASLFGVSRPLCIHWAPAEQIFWRSAMQRISIRDNGNIEWFDLLSVFKSEPIVVKGCLTFGLKDIASTLKKHGLIETSWAEEGEDGKNAMIKAWKAHEQAKEMGISMNNTEYIKDIIKYNEVDVKVMYEIMEYLRNNHMD